MLIDVPVSEINLERQSAVLFFAPESKGDVSSKLHLFTLLFAFLPLLNHARGL